jgi:hypothetical protein
VKNYLLIMVTITGKTKKQKKTITELSKEKMLDKKTERKINTSQ